MFDLKIQLCYSYLALKYKAFGLFFIYLLFDQHPLFSFRKTIMISRLTIFPKFFLSLFILMSFSTPSFGEGPKGSELEKATMLFEKANALSQKKDFKGAIASYKQSIKINPNLGSVHYNLANIYIAVDDLDSAIAEYKKAIKLDPKMSDFHRNLGFAYALKKDGENAKKKYEELKKLDPVQAEVLFQWIQQGK